jgi:hypothetical protein
MAGEAGERLTSFSFRAGILSLWLGLLLVFLGAFRAVYCLLPSRVASYLGKFFYFFFQFQWVHLHFVIWA